MSTQALHSEAGRRLELDSGVCARMARVSGRVRRSVALEGVAVLCGFLLISAAVQVGLDHLSHGMRWSMRAALLAGILGSALWIVWQRMVCPLRVRFGAVDIAHVIERRYPQLSSVLVSAVRFASGQVGPLELNSPALQASVVEQAGRTAGSLDFDVVLNPARARWSAAAIAAVLAVFVGAAWARPGDARLWFERNVLLREVAWPKQTTLVVELQGGELVGARGDDLVVAAHAEGVQPREVEIFYRTRSGRRGRQSMVTVGSEGAYRYRYTFEKADEDFTFYLRGGDDETIEYPARLLERPRVVRTEMRIEPPAYTRMEPSVLADGQRAAQVLRGSRVTILATTNHTVSRATLMSGEAPAADAIVDGDRCSVTIEPAETKTYFLRLVDPAGLENREVVRFALQVVKDESPRVRLKIAGVGDMITPEAILPLEMEFEDAYGLASAEIVVQVTREETREETLPPPNFEAGTTKHNGTLAWPVASAGVQPGERLTLFVRAKDYDDVSGPNEGRSPEINLRVVTKEELLTELARREQRHRDDFERIVDLQEQTRSRLLTLLGKAQSAEARPDDSAASLERTQRNLGGSVNVVRQQFERILKELEINQLNTLASQERLGSKIIEPLAGLVRRDFPLAADTIRQFSTSASTVAAEKIDGQQVQLLKALRDVLANMASQAGYQEIVTMLRDIIRLQEDLKKETQKAVEEQAEGVFDD